MKKCVLLFVLSTFFWTLFAWAGGTAFNGTDRSWSIPNVAALQDTSYTLALWVKMNSSQGGTRRILIKDGQFNIIRGGGVVTFEHAWSSMPGKWALPSDLSIGVWTHLCISYDGSSTANDPNIYVNGAIVSETETSTPAGTALTSTSVLCVAGGDSADGCTGAVWFDAAIADLVFYSRPLAAGECKSVYSNGPKSISSGLVGNWPGGVFGARNYTSTTGLNGTVAGSPTVDTTGPPLSYPQGSTRGLRWR